MTFDALVLAGGRARRLGGIDKPALELAGRSLLERVVDAVAGAGLVVVVGPRRPLQRSVTWIQEEPPGAGPVAAVAAGLEAVEADVVVVLAADLPLVDSPQIERLVAAAEGGDGAVAVDGSGREQYLAGAYRVLALRRAVRALGRSRGASMRELTRPLGLEPVTLGAAALDCDTWADVAAARHALGAGGSA
jgi:molybdopterin-guanine dinucleotide biosynthesis protein A